MSRSSNRRSFPPRRLLRSALVLCALFAALDIAAHALFAHLDTTYNAHWDTCQVTAKTAAPMRVYTKNCGTLQVTAPSTTYDHITQPPRGKVITYRLRIAGFDMPHARLTFGPYQLTIVQVQAVAPAGNTPKER